MKRTLRLILIGLVLATVVWLLGKTGIWKMPDFLGAKPIKIENTPVLLQEIKAIGEWQTATMYAEVVADTLRYNQIDALQDAVKKVLLPGVRGMGGDRMVLIVRGRVIAGIQWQQLVAQDIFTQQDSVSLKLPPVQILDVIANPTDVNVFIEEGDWSGKTVSLLTQQARRKLIAEAQQQQLQTRAYEQVRRALAHLLAQAGFTKITFIPA